MTVWTTPRITKLQASNFNPYLLDLYHPPAASSREHAISPKVGSSDISDKKFGPHMGVTGHIRWYLDTAVKLMSAMSKSGLVVWVELDGRAMRFAAWTGSAMQWTP